MTYLGSLEALETFEISASPLGVKLKIFTLILTMPSRPKVKNARLGGFEGMGALVRVILVYKSDLGFLVGPLGVKLVI